MPFCRKCGNQLDEQASFCPRCGTPVSPIAPPAYAARRRTYPYVPVAVIAGVLFFALILFLAFSFSWIPSGTIVGSGNVVAQDRLFSGFSSIGISSGFAFAITQSSSYTVRTIADDNIQNDIQISQSGGTLSVGLKPAYSVTTSTLRVEISMPSLGRLELSGGAHGSVKGFVSTSNFVVDASGGSKVQMEGQANDLTINGSGGSQLDLSDFAVRNANVNLSGGSTADVDPSGRIDANLSGGSHLYYSDNPALGSINVSGGSTIGRR
jgi:hypothetical protein